MNDEAAAELIYSRGGIEFASLALNYRCILQLRGVVPMKTWPRCWLLLNFTEDSNSAKEILGLDPHILSPKGSVVAEHNRHMRLCDECHITSTTTETPSQPVSSAIWSFVSLKFLNKMSFCKCYGRCPNCSIRKDLPFGSFIKNSRSWLSLAKQHDSDPSIYSPMLLKEAEYWLEVIDELMMSTENVFESLATRIYNPTSVTTVDSRFLNIGVCDFICLLLKYYYFKNEDHQKIKALGRASPLVMENAFKDALLTKCPTVPNLLVLYVIKSIVHVD